MESVAEGSVLKNLASPVLALDLGCVSARGDTSGCSSIFPFFFPCFRRNAGPSFSATVSPPPPATPLARPAAPPPSGQPTRDPNQRPPAASWRPLPARRGASPRPTSRDSRLPHRRNSASARSLSVHSAGGHPPQPAEQHADTALHAHGRMREEVRRSRRGAGGRRTCRIARDSSAVHTRGRERWIWEGRAIDIEYLERNTARHDRAPQRMFLPPSHGHGTPSGVFFFCLFV